MGKFDKILKSLSKLERAAPAGKVPFKVVDDMGELALHSPKAKATAGFRSLDTVEMMDPEMVPYLEKLGENPIYIESLEADKGFGSKALRQLEKSAKKRGADVAYLNASPLGGTRGLDQEAAAAKVRDFYKNQGYQVADDYGTNAMMYKKLMAGAPASIGLTNPLDYIKKAATTYNEAKQKIADPLAGQLDLTKDGSLKDDYSAFLGMALDPVNLVPGAAGVGLGAIGMLGDSPKKQDVRTDALKKMAWGN